MILIRNILFNIGLVISTTFFGLTFLLLLPFSFNLVYKYCATWGKSVVWLAKVFLGITFKIKYPENIPDKAGIVYCKHQSAYETMIFPWFFPAMKPCFVYKKELHKVPGFGWGLANLRMIPITRSDRRTSMTQVVELGTKRLQEGRLVVLFPEGTRTKTGETGRYKMGAALLSHASGFPLYPIAHNTGLFWPKSKFLKKPGVVTLSFGPAIYPENMTAEELNQKAQDWVEHEMRVIDPASYQDA